MNTTAWQSFRAYQASLSASLFPSRLTMTDPHCDFRAMASTQSLGRLSFIKAHANSTFYLEPYGHRDRRLDCYVLHLQLSGESAYQYPDGKVSCASDTILLTDARRVLLAEQHSPADALVVRIPADILREQIQQVDDLCWSPVMANEGAADILRNFVLNLWSRNAELGLVNHQFLSLSLFNLIRSVFHWDAGGQRAARHERDWLYGRLRQEILARIGRKNLTVTDLAHAMGMSRSKLYRLTSQIGTTVERLIIDVRLEHVADRLSQPGGTRLSLTELAFEAGFCDLSHFSRSFKQKFGTSPSRYRGRAEDTTRREPAGGQG